MTATTRFGPRALHLFTASARTSRLKRLANCATYVYAPGFAHLAMATGLNMRFPCKGPAMEKLARRHLEAPHQLPSANLATNTFLLRNSGRSWPGANPRHWRVTAVLAHIATAIESLRWRNWTFRHRCYVFCLLSVHRSLPRQHSLLQDAPLRHEKKIFPPWWFTSQATEITT